MQTPSWPDEEASRLEAVRRYEILDTPAEAAFDDLTLMAAEICEAPVGLITLVDSDRQWFKSRVGLDASETARSISFCGHAILSDDLFEVADTRDDHRFADNPLVTGGPGIRFYAGAPLVTSDGFRIGTLCVIDRVPRALSERQRRALTGLSRQVVRQMEARSLSRELEQRARFQEALMHCQDLAIITTDAKGMVTRFNAGAEAMLGHAGAEICNRTSLASFYDPDLLAERAGALSKKLQRDIAPDFSCLVLTQQDGPFGSGEWRYRRRDGSALPVRVVMTPLYDAAGRTIGYLSSARDIGEQKSAAQALQQSERFLQTLLDALPVGVYAKRLGGDAPAGTGDMLLWNRAAERMLGINAAAVAGGAGYAGFASEIAAVQVAHDKALLETRAPVAAPAYPIRHADGKFRMLRMSSVPLLDEQGEVAYAVGIAEDITELKEAELEARRASRVDHLTQLPNRAQFFDVLEAAIARSKRLERGVAVVFLDIDHFHKLNEQIGNPKGDLVLQEFAHRVKHAVRITDTVARLAADEFVVVLEGLHGPDEAEHVTQKILDALGRTWLLDGERLTLSFSAGIAYDQTHAHSAAALIGYADKLLYVAKSTGGDTFRITVC